MSFIFFCNAWDKINRSGTFRNPNAKTGKEDTIMDSLIDLQMIVCPDLLTTMQKRFRLLHTIQLLQPIGRRSLADQINMKERVVRNHIDFLTQQGLLSVSQKGVYLTNHGDEILTALVPYIEKMNRFDVLEEKVKQILKDRKSTRLNSSHVAIS